MLPLFTKKQEQKDKPGSAFPAKSWLWLLDSEDAAAPENCRPCKHSCSIPKCNRLRLPSHTVPDGRTVGTTSKCKSHYIKIFDDKTHKLLSFSFAKTPTCETKAHQCVVCSSQMSKQHLRSSQVFCLRNGIDLQIYIPEPFRTCVSCWSAQRIPVSAKKQCMDITM